MLYMVIFAIIHFISLIIWFFTWIFLGKIVFDKVYYKKISLEMELLSNNNAALAFSFSGFVLGFIFALVNSIEPTDFIYQDAITGTLVMLLVLLFTRTFDWIFLRRIDLPTEIIDKKNIASGIVEGSFFLSMGIIVAGGFSGEDLGSWTIMSLESILYCVIGLVFLFISSIIMSKLLKVDLQEELDQDNRAVGASFAGIFIGVSLAINNAISGPMQKSLLYDLRLTLIDWIISLVFMIIFFYVFDLILFRKFSFKTELKEPNLGAGIILGGIFVVSSFLSSLIVQLF